MRILSASIQDKLMEYKARPIVIDPVMVSKSRYRLLKPEAEAAVVELVAIADVILPIFRRRKL